MGNLYTQIVKRPNNERIGILSELKALYRTTPRDTEKIKELQEKLKPLEFKNPPTPMSPKKKYGMFAWKHIQDTFQKG